MQPVNYNEISKVYDDVREGDVILINHFLQELPSDDNLKILDIGCGTGNYSDLFQKVTQAKHYQVYGIEPSEGMISKARQKNNRIIFKQATAEDIPFGDNFFDFVFMTDVIHHIPDIRRMFAEIHRILRPQGKVCIFTQSHRQIEARPIVQFFPGTVRVDQARYPDIDAILAAAQAGGLISLKQEILFEGEPVEIGAGFLELARKKGYSMLHLLTEQEYQTGLRQLEDALQSGPIQARAAGETLVRFMKPLPRLRRHCCMHNTYKLKIWYLLLNSIVALVTLSGLLTLAGVILFFLVFIVIAFRNGAQQTVISLGMFGGVFLLFGILMALFGIVFPVGNALFSYLRTGAPGVELRLWPFYRLKCAWHQVIGIEQVKILRGLLCLPMLRFTEGEIETWPIRSRGRKSNYRPEIHGGHHATFSENPSGLTFLLVSFLIWSVNDMNLIPVYIFTGWPNGKLRQDLERRLGHIRG